MTATTNMRTKILHEVEIVGSNIWSIYDQSWGDQATRILNREFIEALASVTRMARAAGTSHNLVTLAEFSAVTASNIYVGGGYRDIRQERVSLRALPNDADGDVNIYMAQPMTLTRVLGYPITRQPLTYRQVAVYGENHLKMILSLAYRIAKQRGFNFIGNPDFNIAENYIKNYVYLNSMAINSTAVLNHVARIEAPIHNSTESINTRISGIRTLISVEFPAEITPEGTLKPLGLYQGARLQVADNERTEALMHIMQNDSMLQERRAIPNYLA